MAGTVGAYQQGSFTTPIDGDALDASVVLGNDNNNRSKHNSHDNDATIHIQSSVLGSRPAAGTAQRVWITTDGLRAYVDSGSVWGELAYLPSVGGTVSGAVTISSGGLTVSAGTTAVQALTATTGTFSSDVVTTGAVRAGSGDKLYWNSRTVMKSPSDGVMTLLNNAETDFTRVQFGGTTSSFPALKRSSAVLVARLADDSADAAFTCAALTATTIAGTTGTFSGAVSMTALTATTGTLSGALQSTNARFTAAAPTVAASQVGIGSTVSTTANVGANGALPATVEGYLVINVAGTTMKVPYYTN